MRLKISRERSFSWRSDTAASAAVRNSLESVWRMTRKFRIGPPVRQTSGLGSLVDEFEGVSLRRLIGRAEMGKVAGPDRLDGEDDEHVGGAELAVDNGAIADEGAEPEIALDQRGESLESSTRVDPLARHHVHVDAEMCMRLHAPVLRGKRRVVEEAQRLFMRLGVGALEARAADHHVRAVLAYIGPYALPQ